MIELQTKLQILEEEKEDHHEISTQHDSDDEE